MPEEHNLYGDVADEAPLSRATTSIVCQMLITKLKDARCIFVVGLTYAKTAGPRPCVDDPRALEADVSTLRPRDSLNSLAPSLRGIRRRSMVRIQSMGYDRPIRMLRLCGLALLRRLDSPSRKRLEARENCGTPLLPLAANHVEPSLLTDASRREASPRDLPRRNPRPPLNLPCIWIRALAVAHYTVVRTVCYTALLPK